MKHIIVAACLFAGHFLQGQNASDKMIYLDSLGIETVEGSHISYRIVEDYHTKKKKYSVKEFYKSGKLMKEGSYLDNEGIAETGIITEYYENGHKEKEAMYVESVPLGSYSLWYENGNKKEEGEYLKHPDKDNDKSKQWATGPNKVNHFWDKTGKQTVLDGNGLYLEETDKKFEASGPLKNGFKDGVWTGKDGEIKYTFSETYANGKLLSGSSIDSERVERKYTEAEIKPAFKGGIMAFYKYVMNNFRIPEEDGLNGKIIVTFVISKDGQLSDIKILKDIGYGTGEEALRIISASADWSPAVVRGITVKSQYTLPITIKTAD